MEEARDDCFALVMNWTIHNFGCWNSDIHDPVLTTKDSWFFKEMGLTIELYPRGVSGREEKLLVRLFVECENSIQILDLSFIASDGSLLCTRQFGGIEFSEGVLEIPPGPKFRDVVEHITKNEALHKDQLTLRFRVRPPKGETEENSQIHINSMIETFETTMKIHLEELKGQKQLEDIKGGYAMEYPLNEGETVSMDLTIEDSKIAAESIEMRLEVETCKNKFAVRTLWSLLNSDGSLLRREQNEHVFRDTEDWVISNSLTKEEASQKGYSVVIDFKIIPSNGHKLLSHQASLPMEAFEVIKTSSTSFLKTCDVLKTDLFCLYQDQDFSDLQLKCGDVTFPVHKNILSARSPVFKTMLSTDMVEAASGEVDIADLDPSTLGLFLTYLYTGAVEDLQSDRALKLYYAADKYLVPSLKKECADFLRTNVSANNVCDILSLAHKHEDDQLLSVSHTFIKNNDNEVLASEQWRSFMRSEPLLATETLKFAKNKTVKGSE